MTIFVSGLIGALGGILVGILVYLGLLKFAKKYLFLLTSWMLILLTAGMAAQGASFLIAADILPPLKNQLWDSSNFIASNSFIGTILNVLIGYTPKPTAMEMIFYSVVLVFVGLSYYNVKASSKI